MKQSDARSDQAPVFSSRFPRHLILPLFLFAVALAAGPGAGKVQQGSRPSKLNVLLIVVDDLGYADLGCYGCKDTRTPNLDRLAEQGVRLTDFYASAPICTPSRASLITGRYPQWFGFDWVIHYLEKDRGLPVQGTSLPVLLKNQGYATALYGKWHLGYKPQFGPNAHGFDYYFGFLSGCTARISRADPQRGLR